MSLSQEHLLLWPLLPCFWEDLEGRQVAGPSPRHAAGPRAKLMQERLAVCPEPSLASRAQVLLQDLSNLAGKLHHAVGPLADG